MKKCTIIGISDSHRQWFPPVVMQAIAGGRVFSGGRRHHEIMASHLPAEAQWIDITVPLSDVFCQYEAHDEVVIFASGDPLFFGFASTVQRECPEVEMTVYPSFNSLQMLAHRLCLPYQQMHAVSLTGRPWDGLDEALIRGEALVGCLTDRNKTPHAVQERMLAYGYDNYEMYVGVNLGNEEMEQVGRYDAAADYPVPNCLMLIRRTQRCHPFGIPESDFRHLDGRAKMITKMPIRLLSLAMLDLSQHRTLWDVGFCTGSVSIEAKLQFPHLHIEAFEVREEGRALMAENSRRFGAPGINTHIGDFLNEDLSAVERPDAVFIGGHGGRLVEMVQRLKAVMLPGACIVFNSVSQASHDLFLEAIRQSDMILAKETCITIDDNNPITIMKAIL